MSKSTGNATSPLDVMAKYGADVLRLWITSVDFREDMPYSTETMTRTTDAYRKIRNTLRFLLSNLGGFDPVRDALPAGGTAPGRRPFPASRQAVSRRGSSRPTSTTSSTSSTTP